MRLTPDEISFHRNWLEEWRTPREVLDCIDSVNDYMGSADFFNQGGVSFLRDAWVAGKFAEYRVADAVRLCPEEWPDCEIRVQGTVEAFEITEADREGRRRGNEFRKSDDRGDRNHPLSMRQMRERAESIPRELERVVKQKVNKCYPPNEASLCIYLNLNEFGIRQEETESIFAQVTEIGRNHFRSIWILWKDKAYKVWPE